MWNYCVRMRQQGGQHQHLLYGNCGAKIHREEEDDQEGVLCAVCEGKCLQQQLFAGAAAGSWKRRAGGDLYVL